MLSSITADRGVVYFFGNGYQEMAFASIFSLRRPDTGDPHWKGPITIFPIWSYGDVRVLRACQAIAESKLDVQLGPPIRALVETNKNSPRGVAGMVTKTLLPFMTPFRRTLVVDADTVIVKPIDEVFQGSAPLRLTALGGNWQQLPDYSQRVTNWAQIDSDRVSRIQSGCYPAVNTGVIVFDRPATQLVAWNELSMRGSQLDLPDETAMQLLLPELDFDWLPDIWNFSPQYGLSNGTDPSTARIWHFHGPNRTLSPQWTSIYLPMLAAAKKRFPALYRVVRDSLYGDPSAFD
jgi:hypothetical protein